MKHERTFESQTRRIDREKANTAVTVQALPEKGREGDLVHLGEPPEPPQDSDNGYYLRLNGEWRYLLATTPTQQPEAPGTPEIPDPEGPEFLSQMEDPS